MPRVGILALQGDVREHAESLSDLGVEAVAVRTPSQLDEVEALILPGGESTTMSLLLQSSGLAAPLGERLASGMPAFGTCAGMILLSKRILDGRPDQLSYGALDVTVRRNAFGRQVQSFETDLVVSGLEAPFHAVFIRAPAVEEAGPEVEVLARVSYGSRAELENGTESDARPGPAVLCRQGSVLVAAFHPELSGDRRLHQLFLESAFGNVSATKP